MNMSLDNLLLWAHLLCMVGTFGGVLLLQLALPPVARTDEAMIRGGLRFLSFLVLAGLVLGIALYVVRIEGAKAGGGGLPGPYHMVIGFKFLILFAVAGCFGAASGMVRKGAHAPANVLRWSALVLLAMASLLGVFL